MGMPKPIHPAQIVAPVTVRALQPVFLTLDEAAEQIGCTRRFLEARASEGEIKLFRPSRRLVRVSRHELDRWIEEFSTKGSAQ